jgi:CheY-like chemotaxis protein/anti-sigma regulatory factor (Ser/Thr protein kinase)
VTAQLDRAAQAAEAGGREDEAAAVTFLVVDDSPVARLIAGSIVERTLGWKAVYAEDGRSALAAIEAHVPRIVLTDMNMPGGMGGLELVAAVRKRHPAVPVVLMTAFGNEEVALRALREGAASYVPKKSLDDLLAPTLEQVFAASQVERRQQRLMGLLDRVELRFYLENDPSLVPPLVGHVRPYLAFPGLDDPSTRTRVGVALEEALLNAIYHGNLEVSSELRQQGEEPFRRLAEERRRLAPYGQRRVFCGVRISRERATFVIRDEGPGFDPAKLPDPTDPANLGRIGGRGLLLIRTFMDEVSYNETGNQITLVKRGGRGEA